MSSFAEVFSGLASIAVLIGFVLFGIGGLYWLWVAVQIGSFMMFVAGVVPVFVIVTGPVGAYSLIFGVPEWVVGVFG